MFGRLFASLFKRTYVCTSCGNKVTRPEQALVLETHESEFKVVCCELCGRREQRRRQDDGKQRQRCEG